MQSSQTPQSKQMWLIVLFAFVASVGVYAFLVVTLARNGKLPSHSAEPVAAFREGLYVLAALCLIAAVAFLRSRARRSSGVSMAGEPAVCAPSQFFSATVISLVLAEASSVYGLLLVFLSGHPSRFWPFAAGTVIVDVFFILPLGLNYWPVWEKQQARELR